MLKLLELHQPGFPAVESGFPWTGHSRDAAVKSLESRNEEDALLSFGTFEDRELGAEETDSSLKMLLPNL